MWMEVKQFHGNHYYLFYGVVCGYMFLWCVSVCLVNIIVGSGSIDLFSLFSMFTEKYES